MCKPHIFNLENRSCPKYMSLYLNYYLDTEICASCQFYHTHNPRVIYAQVANFITHTIQELFMRKLPILSHTQSKSYLCASCQFYHRGDRQ